MNTSERQQGMDAALTALAVRCEQRSAKVTR